MKVPDGRAILSFSMEIVASNTQFQEGQRAIRLLVVVDGATNVGPSDGPSSTLVEIEQTESTEFTN